MKHFSFLSLIALCAALVLTINPLQAQNTLYGTDAGASLTTGIYNTLIGNQAGYSITTGTRNVFMGNATGYSTATGWYNVFLGNSAGYNNITGGQNVFVGHRAGYSATKGGNTYIGHQAGYNNVFGENNVFLGNQAGKNTTTSNRLYIANGPDDADVLIYGNFINGRIGIGTTGPSARLTIKQASDGPAEGFRVIAAGANKTGRFWMNDGDLHINRGDNDLAGFVIKTGGLIGVGTDYVPSGYKMAVDGKIITEELKVQLSGAWPDYVFDAGYSLTSLEDVEAHIQQNGHLHNTPSATEVEQDNGFEIGEMTINQQEKIEEIYLHLIELNKEVKALKEENAQLKAALNK